MGLSGEKMAQRANTELAIGRIGPDQADSADIRPERPERRAPR